MNQVYRMDDTYDDDISGNRKEVRFDHRLQGATKIAINMHLRRQRQVASFEIMVTTNSYE